MLEEVGLTHYLALGSFLFVSGLACMILKRNAIGALMGIELILNAAAVNFVAYSRFNPLFAVEGKIFAIVVVIMAAAETALALAIVLNFYNNHATVDVDNAKELKG